MLGLDQRLQAEPWTPVDSVAWLKAMAWDLRGNMQDEIDRSLMTSSLSPTQIAQLYPEYPYSRNRPIVDDGSVRRRPPAADLSAAAPASAGLRRAAQGRRVQRRAAASCSALSDRSDELPALLGPAATASAPTPGWSPASTPPPASRCWPTTRTWRPDAVALVPDGPALPRRSAAACPYDVAGFTFSGMPGVVIGHNQNIAWGFTNLGADVTDLYLEKVTGRHLPVRRQGRCRSPPARRPSRSPAAADRDDHRARRPTTARSSPTAATSSQTSARPRRSATRPRTAAPATPSP